MCSDTWVHMCSGRVGKAVREPSGSFHSKTFESDQPQWLSHVTKATCVTLGLSDRRLPGLHSEAHPTRCPELPEDPGTGGRSRPNWQHLSKL